MKFIIFFTVAFVAIKSVSTAQQMTLDYCRNSTGFVEALNSDADFNVTLVMPCSDQSGFVVIYDPLTDSYDAINLDMYNPDSSSQTAADYYYANSARGFFDLEALPGNYYDYETGTWVPTSYRDTTSGLVFTPLMVDFLSTLSGASNIQAVARQMPILALNGAHHRTMMDAAGYGGGINTWATGDYGRFDKLDAEQAQGEIGVSHNFGIKGFRAGLALGRSSLEQDLLFGGSNDIDGTFVLGEVDYQPSGSPIVFSALGYYGSWDADISRGYLNAGLPDFSRGKTDMETFAFRLRADWRDMYRKGNLSITPRLAYTLVHTQTDAYTEAGGGFPATFSAQDDVEHEIRFGVDTDIQLNACTSLRIMVEAVKRFEDESNLQGTIIGVTPFSLPGRDLKSFWGRAGVELTHDFTDSKRLSFSVHASTEGADPTISGALSYRMKF